MATGEGGQNPTGEVDAARAQDRCSHIPGEPCAVKIARTVREETVRNGSHQLVSAIEWIPRWPSTLSRPV